MPEKYKNKYRIGSARLQNWDYGSNAAYFVTICTQNRESYFGEIVNAEMQLSEIGEIANKCWLEIPEHFPFVKLDVHVVMPNHIHGIVIINKPDDGRNDERNDERNVETQNFASLQSSSQSSPQPPQHSKNQFGPQSQNLASIIRGFKIGVTKNVRLIHADFAWQSRFYDHIIRNNVSCEKIKTYIIENPLKWESDKFHNS